MGTGQNDNGFLNGELGRSIAVVRSIAEKVVSPDESPSFAQLSAGSTESNDLDSTDESPRDRDVAPPESTIPPKERLLGLLEQNDGRMNQRDIVDAVEWSESTVSRKLSALESAGAISRYRIGRGKIVFLPGAEPDCIGSPFGREEEDSTITA